MKKVLILGSAGMVGSSMARYLANEANIDVGGTYNKVFPREGLLSDYFRLDSLNFRTENFLGVASKYDYIINCIMAKNEHGIKSSDDAKNFLATNSIFPATLASIAERVDQLKIINISSDAVYSGRLVKGANSDKQLPDPTCFYGMSKLLSESRSAKVLNIRTSFIGNDFNYHKGLIEWIYSCEHGKVLQGYENYLWSGVTTDQFSGMVSRIIVEDLFDSIRDYSHAVNYSCNDPMSKYELVKLLIKLSGRSDLSVEKKLFPGGSINRSMETDCNTLIDIGKSQRPLVESIEYLISER